MTKSEKDNIERLAQLFKEFRRILLSAHCNDVNYANETIIRIVNYLEDASKDDSTEYSEILAMIRGAYKNMFTPKAGLSEFHIWDNDYAVRATGNQHYEDVKIQIQLFLNAGN